MTVSERGKQVIVIIIIIIIIKNEKADNTNTTGLLEQKQR